MYPEPLWSSCQNTHRGSASAGRDLTEHALQEPSEQTPRHGKRSLTRGTTSGGSSKRSRGSSASDALNRLADLRVQSNDSRTRTEEIKQAKSAKACMELLKADGYTSRDHIYHMVLRVFRDGFLREFFLDDCHTSEGRLYFIQSQYQDMAQYQPLPPFPPGFGGYIQSAPASLFLELIAWSAALCNCIVYNHGAIHNSCF